MMLAIIQPRRGLPYTRVVDFLKGTALDLRQDLQQTLHFCICTRPFYMILSKQKKCGRRGIFNLSLVLNGLVKNNTI